MYRHSTPLEVEFTQNLLRSGEEHILLVKKREWHQGITILWVQLGTALEFKPSNNALHNTLMMKIVWVLIKIVLPF